MADDAGFAGETIEKTTVLGVSAIRAELEGMSG